MRFFGGFIVVLGVLSILLYFLKANFLVLGWVDQWGTQTGWIIRGAVIVLGIVMYAVGKPSDEE